jgi:pseudouridine-5'-phosphate glycosidase
MPERVARRLGECARLDATCVVALETTLSHRFPAPDRIEVNLRVAVGSRRRARDYGVRRRFARPGEETRPLHPRRRGPATWTSVAGFGHHDGRRQARRIQLLGRASIAALPLDVSADLIALVSSPVLVACSGVKSLLDVPATMELLETLGVPVLGFRTDTLPLFYSATGGPPVSQRVEDAATAARIAEAHWQLGGCGLLLANPPPESLDVEDLIEEAITEADRQGVSGQAVTPFVLGYLHEHSGGRTREVNRKLIVANARLAGEVAVAFAAL